MFSFPHFQRILHSGGDTMKTTKELLGERIRELRKERGLTQEQLAELVEVEQKHISRLELGKSFPTIDRLQKVSEALNVPLREFFDFIPLSNPETRINTIGEMISELDGESQKRVFRIFRSIINEFKSMKS
jgi:transcriptional regulator with XRE-family HTH domain